MKLNNAENYEHLANVRLTKDKYPIAFEEKVKELIEECGMTRAQAEKSVEDMEIELEIYYQKGYGLFAVESEAVDAGAVYSPYNKEEYEQADFV